MEGKEESKCCGGVLDFICKSRRIFFTTFRKKEKKKRGRRNEGDEGEKNGWGKLFMFLWLSRQASGELRKLVRSSFIGINAICE